MGEFEDRPPVDELEALRRDRADREAEALAAKRRAQAARDAKDAADARAEIKRNKFTVVSDPEDT